jgi:hypothetical protein
MVKISNPDESFANLQALGLIPEINIFTFPEKSTFIRLGSSRYDPLDFRRVKKRGGGRFDHIQENDTEPYRSILYASPVMENSSDSDEVFIDALSGCIAEVYGDTRKMILNQDNEDIFIFFECTKSLHLIDLRSFGAMRAGTVSAISAIPDREISQSWSRIFYENFNDVDGILYLNAHNLKHAVALYDRCCGNLHLIGEVEPILHFSQRQPFSTYLDEITINHRIFLHREASL